MTYPNKYHQRIQSQFSFPVCIGFLLSIPW